MPTILRYRGFRFFFYSNEHPPAHIHVEKDDKTAKFELDPLLILNSRKFDSKELKIIRIAIEDNMEFFKQSCNEYFSNK